jgi:catechol 2,3-dioxygenase-like lactoylglutathione lyase family enzyme
VADLFKTGPGGPATVRHMALHLEVVSIVVADMARSLAFYRRFGLDLPPEADTEPHVEAVLPGGLKLAWDAVSVIKEIDPEWSPPTGGPGGALAFRCDSPAEVDEVYKSLVDAGYPGHMEPWDAFWGQRYATLRDPDGNGIDIYAPLAK